jgi:hypothetical protein
LAAAAARLRRRRKHVLDKKRYKEHQGVLWKSKGVVGCDGEAGGGGSTSPAALAGAAGLRCSHARGKRQCLL